LNVFETQPGVVPGAARLIKIERAFDAPGDAAAMAVVRAAAKMADTKSIDVRWAVEWLMARRKVVLL
jgi:hypothetical protein